MEEGRCLAEKVALAMLGGQDRIFSVSVHPLEGPRRPQGEDGEL